MKVFFALALMLALSPMVRAEPKVEPVTLDTPSGVLRGTLEVPEVALPCPLVVVIAGSGPTDRDGNSLGLAGANNSLKLLAEGLATRGIASIRYDKRGIAASATAGPEEADLRFDNYIDDAVGWGQKFKGDARFSSLIVLGHSEGSLIGMIAAKRLKADAFISVAGAGHNASEVILTQLRPQLPPDLMKRSEEIIQMLNQGQTTADVPAVLNVLFRPSVQPYLASWFHYDPTKEIANLAMPILIMQGTTDIQVSVENATALSKAKPTAQLTLIVGMNHVLKIVPNDEILQLKSYSDPNSPIAAGLVTAIHQFINGLPKH